MKTIKQTHIWLLMAGILLLPIASVQASSAFSSQGEVGFSLSGPLPPELSVGNVWFDNAIADSGTQSGDGALTLIMPAALPSLTGNRYGFDVFKVSGHVNHGAVLNSVYAGWYNLELLNSGTTSISVELVLDYQLSAATFGQWADSEAKLEYYLDEDLPEFVRVSASTFSIGSDAVVGSKQLSLLLKPGRNVFHADLTIASSMEAAPVPLPAAIWSFLAGIIGLLGMTKRKFADI